MTHAPWESRFQEAMRRILTQGLCVLDIGGGLRVDGSRGNVADSGRAWLHPLLAKTTYHVLDPVDTYRPDIVGDIHAMPIADALYDVVVCLSVLEHVPDPIQAMREMRRVLKPGGMLCLYVPFLSAYHAMPGYYGDYYRWTEDGVRALCTEWDVMDLWPVRGPVETLVHLCPRVPLLGLLHRVARLIDGVRRSTGKQTAGFLCVVQKQNA